MQANGNLPWGLGISSDMIFSVESDGEGPRLKFEREDGQTDGGKSGTCEHL